MTDNLIYQDENIVRSFEKLNNLPETLTLFVLNRNDVLVGTLTDGDIRRGFLRGLGLDKPIDEFMFKSFRKLYEDDINPMVIKEIKHKGVRLLPVLDKNNRIIRVIDFGKTKTILPVDAVIMAGGKGERLRPFTDNIPKPLLMVGSKPIIEHNIDRLIEFGVTNFYICIKHLGEQIEKHLGDGKSKGINITYIRENEPLGTFGAVGLIDNFSNQHVLIMNSDLFTNIDFEDYYESFINDESHMGVATVPYVVDIPYAVLNVENNQILGVKEKPTYTFQSNAGIYLTKPEYLSLIPPNQKFNATDFITLLIESGKKVVRFPIVGYWVDIGKPDEYLKVQEMVKHIQSL